MTDSELLHGLLVDSRDTLTELELSIQEIGVADLKDADNAKAKPGTQFPPRFPTTASILLEITRRVTRQQLSDLRVDVSVETIIHHARALFRSSPRVKLQALFVDRARRLIAEEHVSYGSHESLGAYPREIVKLALQHRAAGIILIRNEPTSVSKPTDEDVRVASDVDKMCRVLDIEYFSYWMISRYCAECCLVSWPMKDRICTRLSGDRKALT